MRVSHPHSRLQMAVDISGLVMTQPAQLLSLAGLVAILGLLHEFFVVRKLGYARHGQAAALAVNAIAYVVICAAFVAFSELFASDQCVSE